MGVASSMPRHLMHVIVIGGGLIGITSAWYLRQAGHDVTVVERQSAAGLETSFANGGQISVSHPEPWANPGAPAQVIRWLGRPDAPVMFRPRADWRQWSWGLRFLMECLPGRTRRNTDAIAALAVFSRDCLHQLRCETGIEYDSLTRGILHLFFDRDSFATAEHRVAVLEGYGIPARVCRPDDCLAIEPALADSAQRLSGGIYAPDDESGDAHEFTQRLAVLCLQNGVQLLFRTSVKRLIPGAQGVSGVEIICDGRVNRLTGDAYVLAAGSYSPLLARPLGESLPVFPVKGYSVTLPLADEAGAPEVSITDESHRIVCSRLGNRLRVAGTAELNGYDDSIDPVRCGAIRQRISEIFPKLRTLGDSLYWAGLRPATPGNVPIIGRSRRANLFYNTGHGTLGWTLACGSGQVLADIVCGRTSAVTFPFHGGRSGRRSRDTDGATTAGDGIRST